MPSCESLILTGGVFMLPYYWVLILNSQSVSEPFLIRDLAVLPEDVVVTSDIKSGRLRFSKLTQANPGTEWTMERLAYLELPRASTRSFDEKIELRSHNKSLHTNTSTEPQLIFIPMKGLITIIISLYSEEGHRSYYFLVAIHTEAIMRCAGAFGSSKPELVSFSSGDSIEDRVIPWSEWGAKYAHFEYISKFWWTRKWILLDNVKHYYCLDFRHPNSN